MNMARSIAILLATFLLAASAIAAGEAGTALKTDDLKAEPFRDAKTVGSLSAGDKVEILKKQGGWFQVKSAKGSGWVRMLSIRRGEARKGSVDTAGVLGLASGRAGTGTRGRHHRYSRSQRGGPESGQVQRNGTQEGRVLWSDRGLKHRNSPPKENSWHGRWSTSPRRKQERVNTNEKSSQEMFFFPVFSSSACTARLFPLICCRT